MSDDISQSEKLPSASRDYVVVARRYRPQAFGELIGQEHVAQALTNAITTDRVGHAYLFTGARGVGKTSAARIFAKALNCEQGPTPTPCNACEICRSIMSGDDVDVLEIDGASNRGIDEIRQLRQNVNVRPSRSRMKIYIIDEVHMLTREAFNALLKTLEEPPSHVKFIFCTTDPNKIPITILSRCQRFDFAGIQTGSIAERLAQIARDEGVEAEPEALEMIARRAAGSMRDGQSLLEQLLAFAPGRITLDGVHAMLGTAAEGRLDELVGCLVARDAAGALASFEAALGQGVDPGLLLEQLFGYFRDCMAASAGCGPEAFLYVSPASAPQVDQISQQLGMHTILAVMQILDQTLGRLRQSTQARILAELALVRIVELGDLDELASLVAQLREGGPYVPPGATTPPPKAALPRPTSSASSSVAPQTRSQPTSSPIGSREDSQPPPSSGGDPKPSRTITPRPLTADNATQIWEQAVGQCSALLAENARQFDRAAISAPNRLAVVFKPEYTFAKSICERPDNANRLRKALTEVTGQSIEVELQVDEKAAPAEEREKAPSSAAASRQRAAQISDHPLVRRAAELFGAEDFKVSEPPKKRDA